MIEEHRHAPGEGNWLLPLPYRRVPLLANTVRKMHWAPLNNLTQQIKSDTALVARSMKVPHMDAVLATLAYYPGQNRGPDSDGIAPTFKAALDGLKLARVIDDDDPTRVLRSSMEVILRRDDPADSKVPALVLHLVNVSALYVPGATAAEVPIRSDRIELATTTGDAARPRPAAPGLIEWCAP